MHLIRDAQGVMVGRVNLSVLGKDRKTAELGYRIGENVTNLGYASEAVNLVLEKAFTTYGYIGLSQGRQRTIWPLRECF